MGISSPSDGFSLLAYGRHLVIIVADFYHSIKYGYFGNPDRRRSTLAVKVRVLRMEPRDLGNEFQIQCYALWRVP